MLHNEPFVEKIGIDTAENGRRKGLTKVRHPQKAQIVAFFPRVSSIIYGDFVVEKAVERKREMFSVTWRAPKNIDNSFWHGHHLIGRVRGVPQLA